MNKKKAKTLFPDNLKTIRHYHKVDCIEFGKIIKCDGKRLSEVERGRLQPTETEIDSVLALMNPMTREMLLNSLFHLSIQIFPTR